MGNAPSNSRKRALEIKEAIKAKADLIRMQPPDAPGVRAKRGLPPLPLLIVDLGKFKPSPWKRERGRLHRTLEDGLPVTVTHEQYTLSPVY